MDYGKWLKKEMTRISARGQKTKNIEALMKRLKKSTNHYYTYERGEIDLTPKEIAICAEFFGVEPPTKQKPSAETNVIPFHPPGVGSKTIEYPVLGVVDAGAFREADMLAQVDPRTVPGPANTAYPHAAPMAWEARGDSMNEAKIFDGTILLGVDFQQAGAVLTNDMVVVVQQNRGGLIERSVKAVAVYPDRIEFQPRSSNPLHKPFVYENGGDDGVSEVTVLSIIHCTVNLF
jgi:SOS-response transcriptional repressor LexA